MRRPGATVRRAGEGGHRLAALARAGPGGASPSEPVGSVRGLATLVDLSGTAHLVQMFDSTVTRAPVSAAGAKGGGGAGRSDARGAVSARRST